MNELRIKNKQEIINIEGNTCLTNRVNSNYSVRRQVLVSQLSEVYKGVENFRDFISPGKIYEVKIPFFVQKQLDNGNFNFLHTKNGDILATIVDVSKKRRKIVHNLRLSEVKVFNNDFANNLRNNIINIQTQQQYAELSQMLGQVQISIDQVKRGQITDRIGQVLAGRNQIEQALSLPDSNPNKDYLLRDAIKGLNEGRAKIELSLIDYVNERIKLPKNKIHLIFLSLLDSNNYDKIETQYYSIQEGMKAYFEATGLLVTSYTLINSEEAIKEIVDSTVNFVRVVSMRMNDIAALVKEGNSDSENWFDDVEKIISRIVSLNDFSHFDDAKQTVIEITGDELIREIEYANLYKMQEGK